MRPTMDGKMKNMHGEQRRAARQKPDLGKVPVVGAKDRATNKVSARTIVDADKPTLHGFVSELAAPGATVFTDEGRAYHGLPFDHETVRHSAGEYVKGQASTNGMESFWSLADRRVALVIGNASVVSHTI